MGNIRDVIPFPRTLGSADFQSWACCSARLSPRAVSLLPLTHGLKPALHRRRIDGRRATTDDQFGGERRSEFGDGGPNMLRDPKAGLWLLIASTIAAHGCSGAGAGTEIERPPAVTASDEELNLARSANGDFAADLYQQLAKDRPGENLFFSPFS